MQLTNRAPLVATDKLKEECECGLEDTDHKEGVQHPTGYEPLERRQRRKVGKNLCDKLVLPVLSQKSIVNANLTFQRFFMNKRASSS